MTQIDALPLARIDHDAAKALKAAVSADENRPMLHNVMIRDRIAEATNGHVMVQVPLRDASGEEFALPADCVGNRFLLPGASLVHVRPGTALEVDMRTGDCRVISASQEPREGYPIELPPAAIETEGMRYPDIDKIVPVITDEHRRVRLGAGVIRAMVAFAGGNANELGTLVLAIPPEDDDVHHVNRGISFTKTGENGRSGLLMPMRIIDGFEGEPEAPKNGDPVDPAQTSFDPFPEPAAAEA